MNRKAVVIFGAIVFLVVIALASSVLIKKMHNQKFVEISALMVPPLKVPVGADVDELIKHENPYFLESHW